jgi:hypothetical protein
MDFMAGKDVGLGLFGENVETVLSSGVRIAQFDAHSSVDIRARPDLHFWFVTGSAASPNRFNVGPYFHTYHDTENASRKFRGVGPSISWSGSVPVAEVDSNGLDFDWGANAAVLFGRQKADVHHYQTGRYWAKHHKTANGGANTCVGQYNCVYFFGPTVGGRTSNRSVAVPNIGGFAGVSYRYQNAKVSLGYRADFFFGAIDGGIDTRKSQNLNMSGPFATISFGLGG